MSKQQNIQLENGATIWLPPDSARNNVWLPDPNNDVDSSLRYDIGTRLTKDERAWRYAKVGDVDADGVTRCIRRGSGVINTSCINSYTDKLVAETGFNTLSNTKLKVDMTTHVNYLNTATAVAENDYRGGHFTLYTSSSYWGCRIVSNTAEDANGYVEIELESPLPVTLTSSHILMFEESPYWNVQYPGNSANWGHVVGFPCIWSVSKTSVTAGPVSDGNGIWLQTWGPFEGIIMGNATGAGETERAGFFAKSPNSGAYPDEDYYPGMAADACPQYCGYFMANNYLNGSPVDFDYNYLTTVFLMIAS